MSEQRRQWIITTEQRQAREGECYVYANEDQNPHVFPCCGSEPTNADDPGGPYRHAILAVAPRTGVDVAQGVRIVASWRRIAESGTTLTGPKRATLTVERSALMALVEVAERGIEARQP